MDEKISPRLLQTLEVLFLLLVVGAFISIIILQFAALLLVPAGIYLLFKHRRHFPDRSLAITVSAFVVSGGVSILISPEPAKSLPLFLHHIVLWSVVPILFLFRYSRRIHIRQIASLLTILAVLVSITGIARHFTGVERAYGFTGGYFTLAAILVVTLPLTTGLGTGRLIIWISILLQVTAVWFTYTRSAFLAIILGFSLAAVLLLVYHRKNLSVDLGLRVAGFIVPVLILITLILFSSDTRINPASGIQGGKETQLDLSSGRSGIILDAKEILSENIRQNQWGRLLFGYGLASRKILVESIFRSWESDYLEALMNQGIVGLLLLLFIYWKFLVMVFKQLFNRDNPVSFSYAVSGLGFWLMSFLTIQLLGIYNPVFFAVLAGALTHAGRAHTGEHNPETSD